MKFPRLRSSRLLGLSLLLLSCGGGGSMTPPPQQVTPTSMVVTTSGGEVATSDGNLAVTIPAGALGQSVMITVEGAEAPAAGNLGTVYEIGPTGTQFAVPVTLKLKYTTADLDGAPESSLRVATFAGGAWQLLPGAIVDTQSKTVSGVTTHLSPYAIVVESAGKTCASVFGGSMCSAPDTSVGGGNLAPTCTPTTCADATDACHAYPGSTRDTCAEGDKGYAATCCFAPQAPICFAVAGGSACHDTTTSAGGGTVACPAPPTCATASTACAAYPGATLQGCTDTVDGYSGGCCFPADAPVCVAVTVARGCAGSTAVGGTGTADCAAPPRCEDANPCANYPGGKVQSCSNTQDGFTASCCFANGTLPVSSPPQSSGMTTGAAGTGGTGTIDPGTGGAGARTGTGGSPSGGTTGGSASGGTTGGGTGGASSTGKGGSGGTIGIDPLGCMQDAVCQPGQSCGGGSPDSCIQCDCGANGHLVCKSCPSGTGTGGAGGTAGAGGTTGGAGGSTGGVPTTCAPDAACDPGQRCGAKTADSCLDCACGANNVLVCNPCAGTGTGGTTGAGGITGAGGTTGAGATTGAGGSSGGVPTTCAPDAACEPRQRCGAKTADRLPA